MKHFNDWVTLAFGTPVVSGAVVYLLAHLTGIIKVLRGGNISVQQVADTAKTLDPALYEKAVARIHVLEADAEADAEHRATEFEAAVQKRVADALQDVAGYLTKKQQDAATEADAPPVAPAP